MTQEGNEGLAGRTAPRSPFALAFPKMRLGDLIPEFPGQTHAFIWHEKTHLERLVLTGDLVSTRRPIANVTSHEWSAAAMRRTTYLCDGVCSVLLASEDEALGVATMEAMAMEVPVVVTDLGGLNELVCQEVDGFLIPPRGPI